MDRCRRQPLAIRIGRLGHAIISLYHILAISLLSEYIPLLRLALDGLEKFNADGLFHYTIVPATRAAIVW